ncbi:Crp/Fnr family transcriptional regulator [Hymenobacter sp. RP-2-7]|uniref:Crp/Fnr family transcriptional regulator n=1 Tax=Hymenobacter polaris TaxID=2682546 RepID=A0A7Y0AD81_9BACT|nr:Crp/Fnr family transcriptional regulator [Hymenobacter polaris]NML65182.1 Crp/Fnr family transcriptional regulator [Hymenobacter polaris]
MSYPALDDFLLHCAPFTPQQLALIASQATERHYPAGAYFSEAGRVAREIAFVLEGVFRICYFDREGTEITKYFLEAPRFMIDLPSYQYQLPATEYVQAVTPARVLVFADRDWQALGCTIVGWPGLERTLITRSLLEMVERLSALGHADAATKYTAFLRTYPHLANQVPLAYLASYLGITPQSLSRVRRNLGRQPDTEA